MLSMVVKTKNGIDYFNKILSIANIFAKENMTKSNPMLKIFPMPPKYEAKTWYNNLRPRSVTSL